MALLGEWIVLNTIEANTRTEDLQSNLEEVDAHSLLRNALISGVPRLRRAPLGMTAKWTTTRQLQR